MTTILNRLNRDRRGASALEYGIMAALIAVAIIAGVGTLGQSLGNLFNTVAGNISAMPANTASNTTTTTTP